jgi:hypothetical protein
MIQTAVRHISQDFYYSVEGISFTSNTIEKCSCKSVTLLKNKTYKIKNLNVIVYKQSGNRFIANVSYTLIFNNDPDFLNNITAKYNSIATPASITYTDSIGTSSSFPNLQSTFIDIEPIRTRGTNSPIRNVLTKTKISTESTTWSDVFLTGDSFVNLLRKTPVSFSDLSSGSSLSFLYSNYVRDFSFYNNLSNKLNILCYLDGITSISTSDSILEIYGTIDFDLEEFEPEEN